MKTAQLVKIISAGALLTTNILVSGLANAQALQSTETEAPTVVASHVQTPDSAQQPLRDVMIRGGYNVGPGVASRVPDCTGPVSFCNMYRGN